MNLAIQCNICHALAHLKKLYLAVYIIFKMFTLYNRKFLLCLLHGHMTTARGRVLEYK